MEHDRDVPEQARWTTEDVADLAQLAQALHRLARPQLYEALSQRALVQTVQAFPADVPVTDLARAVADDALRRALRDSGGTGPMLSARVSKVSEADWQFAYNLAVAELTEDAARELQDVRRVQRPFNS
jgi:hypothetical protein